MTNTLQTTPRRQPQRNPAVRIGAGCLLILGAPFLLGGIVALFQAATPENVGGAYAALFMGTAFAGSGFVWLKWMKKRELHRLTQYHEKLVLDIAALHDGVVTVAQISQSTPLTIQEAESTLARLSVQGLARPEVLDDGVVVYRFIGLGPFRLDT